MSSLVKEGRPMPTKLSEWLRVAVEDVRRLPAECSTPELRFEADMSCWVSAGDEGVCRACLAGSALIGAGLWSPSKSHFASSDDGIALALNELRAGNVDGALDAFLGAEIVPERTPRVERAAERVFNEAWEACDPEYGDHEDYSREEAVDELAGSPSAKARASDEAYLELAAALEEMGL